MQHVFNDGGREAAGFKGHTGDCCIRAFAIATGKPYQEVYDLVNQLAKTERPGSKCRRGRRSTARTGVFGATAHRLAYALAGAHLPGGQPIWWPCCQIGLGAAPISSLPTEGRLVVRFRRHYAAMIDGVIHDTFDPTYGRDRVVYGYWRFA